MANLLELFKALSPAERRQLGHYLYQTGMFPGSGGSAATLPLDFTDALEIENTQHAIDGVYHSGTLANDHAQAHDIDGADHTFPGGGTTWLRDDGTFIAPPAASSIVAPSYIPPSFTYKDADEITLRAGRYHVMGYRHRGQYQEPSSSYWDIAVAVDVDVDATYSVGISSGMIGGAKVNSSWYSIFLMGDAGICLFLPYIRIDTISYGAPSTTITPAAHLDGTTAENGFLVANDAWNNYRLIKISYDAYDGTVHTIADSVNGTPDQILITGDKTSELAVTEWLQMIPPAATNYLYLGSQRINSSGDLDVFVKGGLSTVWSNIVAVAANKATSASLANTDVNAAVPPTAQTASAALYLNLGTTTTRGAVLRLYTGSLGSVQRAPTLRWSETSTNFTGLFTRTSFLWPFSAVAQVRNHAAYYDTSNVEKAVAAGDDAYLQFDGWDE